MSKYEIDFWWWIHILHFKYVWNLPTLSLAWFFFFHIEFRTICLVLFVLKYRIHYLLHIFDFVNRVYSIWNVWKKISSIYRGILLSSCIPSSSQHQCCVSLVIFSYLEGPWSLKGSLTKTLRLSPCVCILKETMLG